MRSVEYPLAPTDAPGGPERQQPAPPPSAACWSQPRGAGAGWLEPAGDFAPHAGEDAGGPRLVRIWVCDLEGQGDRWIDDLPIAPSHESDGGACYASYLSTLVHPEDGDEVLRELQTALHEEQPFSCRYRVCLADGTQRTLHDRGRIVRDADGTARRLLGVTHDVTDWPPRSRGSWAAAPARPGPFETGSLQGLLVHRAGIPLYANGQMAILLGYESVEHLLARANLPRLAAGTAPDGHVRELAWTRADGATLWVQAASRIVEWDGMPACQLAVVDITARKQLEAELEQMRAIGATGALAAGLVHDFNNLLQLVASCAGLLGRSLPKAGPPRNRVDQILRATERGSRLVRKLLNLGQAGAVEPTALDVNEVVGALVSLIQPTLPSRYQLEFRAGARLPAALGDASALEQILLNLLLNARDAMPDGGTLAIETTRLELSAAQAAQSPGARPGPFVRIAVCDAGHGMDEEVQARMFEPFYSTKLAQAGSGLGLSVVRSLVAAQQGFLTITSRPGAGTRVAVCLPLAPAAGAAADEAADAVEPVSPAPQTPPARGLTVLVADADPWVGRLIARFLEEDHHKTLCVTSGREVLAEVARHGTRLSLVLLASSLEGGGELEVLAQVQARMPELPVVVMSHGALTPEEMFLFQASGRRPLRKPFHLRDLLDAVEDSQRGVPIV